MNQDFVLKGGIEGKCASLRRDVQTRKEEMNRKDWI
jgi:hypothetical protein